MTTAIPEESNKRSECFYSGLGFQDLYIIPQFSSVSSREKIDISIMVGKMNIRVPVISANMDSITGSDMAIAMKLAGSVGALHRFMSVEKNVTVYQQVRHGRNMATEHSSLDCFVSIGVNRDSKERAAALFSAGARYFIVDIAHGHSQVMKDMLEWLRKEFGSDIFIMAGNVATKKGAYDLASWSANFVKVGIANGKVCTTKNVTGVNVPQIESISSARAGVEEYSNDFFLTEEKRPMIVADGGIREIGDIALAIAVGADLVMAGSLFSGTDEAIGEVVGGKMVYRGMASRDAMKIIRSDDGSMPTAEGTSILVEPKGSVKNIVKDIAGGLRSSMSYSNSRNLKEFYDSVKIGVRRVR